MSEQTDILEILQFMQENMASKEDIKSMATKDDLKSMASKDDIRGMATKDDIHALRIELREDLKANATKDDLLVFKSDIMTSIDRFAKLHETLDQELVAMRSKYERLEARLEAVELKVGLAV